MSFANDNETTDDGQMNVNLCERSRGSPFPNNGAVPNDNIPVSAPSRANNDIRKYYELSKKPVAGGAWLSKPEIPNVSELLSGKAGFTHSEDQVLVDVESAIRPHKVEGAYDDNEDYLGTTYELLREDTLRPLRKALDEIRAAPFKDEAEYNDQSIGIYDPVYIKGLVFSPRGLATRVAFSLSRVKKRIR